MIDTLETAIHNFIIALFNEYKKEVGPLEAKRRLAKFLDERIDEFANANSSQSSYINAARKTTALMDVERILTEIDRLLKADEILPDDVQKIRHELVDMRLKLRRA
jgi:hypothetical protein